MTTRARVVLGHGAAGDAAAMRPFIDGLVARGVPARAIDLPRSGRSVVKAEAAVPAFASALGDGEDVIGGHSYGGRVASLLAAERPFAALLLFSYPLHAPGRSEAWEARTAHWPHIACPVLLLSGEADPFANTGLLRQAVARLPDAELVTYPRTGHTMLPVLDDVLDRAARFLRERADPVNIAKK